MRSAVRGLFAGVALVVATVLVAAVPVAAVPVAVATQPRLGEVVRTEPDGSGWRVWYRSTSWRHKPTVVSGTISLPEGRPPAGGWPVISFGPGFNGTPDACANSRTGIPTFVRPLQDALLGAGYAVVVTDYEGIGLRGESSVVDGPSEAYAMIDIVRAARRLAPVSRSWLAAGYSLGGHAALSAGALARGYAPDLRHTGTIALAPTTQWALQFAAARNPLAPANPAVPYMGRTLRVTHPGEFRASEWFTPEGMRLVRLAGRVCIEEMAAALAGLTNADLFRDVDAAMDQFTELFAEEEIPVQAYPRPVRLAHGTIDALPAVLTEITATQLGAAGTDVGYAPIPGADHFTVLAAAAPQVVAWSGELFAGE